jgi:hypothetical protein
MCIRRDAFCLRHPSDALTLFPSSLLPLCLSCAGASLRQCKSTTCNGTRNVSPSLKPMNPSHLESSPLVRSLPLPQRSLSSPCSGFHRGMDGEFSFRGPFTATKALLVALVDRSFSSSDPSLPWSLGVGAPPPPPFIRGLSSSLSSSTPSSPLSRILCLSLLCLDTVQSSLLFFTLGSPSLFHTRFTLPLLLRAVNKTEIKQWYSGFIKDCPTGQLDKDGYGSSFWI